MEWVNTVLLVVLVVFALYEKGRVKALEKALAFQRNKLCSQADILASQRDVMALQKDILASHQHALDTVLAKLDIPIPERTGGEAKIKKEAIELKRRKAMAEEKSKFEREVEGRTKTLDWYEKEFSVGLDALLELLLNVPLGTQESIISKMPNSVIRKGFKRLSDKMLEYEMTDSRDALPSEPPRA